ncbi:MAG: STAS domain-containing protein [Magnetococcales bacterium]|nr:STAS domain-containing protein [Magnetococcales bacterium]
MNMNLASGSILVKRTSRDVRIAIRGAFTHSLRREFRESYYTCPANTHYVLDFSEVSAIDSGGIGMLLILRKHAGDAAANISLVNVPLRVSNILKLSKLDELFDFV